MTIYGPDLKMGAGGGGSAGDPSRGSCGGFGMFHQDYVEWTVRCEYEMLNKSINQDEPRCFKIIYNVNAHHIQEAWDLAMKAFSMELLVENKIYGRVEMRVKIET